jgi:hypothetical protein
MAITLKLKNVLGAEYKRAKILLEPQKELAKHYRNDKKRFGLGIEKFFESLIMVKGHAWCMDVKSERRKMSKLVTKAILEVL